MYSKWLLVLVMAATASAVSACEDEIVDVDIPKDGAAAPRDGATTDAPAADATHDAAVGEDANADADQASDAPLVDASADRAASDRSVADSAADRSANDARVVDANPERVTADAGLDVSSSDALTGDVIVPLDAATDNAADEANLDGGAE